MLVSYLNIFFSVYIDYDCIGLCIIICCFILQQLQSFPSFSCPAFLTPDILSVIFMSCIFHPWFSFVRHFPVLHFQSTRSHNARSSKEYSRIYRSGTCLSKISRNILPPLCYEVDKLLGILLVARNMLLVRATCCRATCCVGVNAALQQPANLAVKIFSVEQEICCVVAYFVPVAWGWLLSTFDRSAAVIAYIFNYYVALDN